MVKHGYLQTFNRYYERTKIMTISVSFGTAQIQVNNSSTGIQLSQVILPYSIRNLEDFTQYLGGQMTLGQSDGIKLTDNTKDWKRIGLAKIKNMVADAQLVVPEPEPEYVPDEDPAQSEAPTSEATTEAPKNVTVSNIDSNSITIGGE